MKYHITRMNKDEQAVNEELDEVIETPKNEFFSPLCASKHYKSLSKDELKVASFGEYDKFSIVMTLENGDCIFADAEEEI